MKVVKLNDSNLRAEINNIIKETYEIVESNILENAAERFDVTITPLDNYSDSIYAWRLGAYEAGDFSFTAKVKQNSANLIELIGTNKFGRERVKKLFPFNKEGVHNMFKWYLANLGAIIVDEVGLYASVSLEKDENFFGQRWIVEPDTTSYKKDNVCYLYVVDNRMFKLFDNKNREIAFGSLTTKSLKSILDSCDTKDELNF